MKRMIRQYFKIAVRNIKTRRLRSWLTIIGIVIGIFLVIALISLSSGLKNSMMKQLNALGGDIILVMPGSSENPLTAFMGGQVITKEDIEAIKKVKGVDVVLPTSQRAELMRFNNVQKSVFLVGMPWEEGKDFLTGFQGWSLAEGRWPLPGKRDIVVGSLVAEKKYFGKEIKEGCSIVINGRTFNVVGILNPVGNQGDDSSVHTDMSIYRQVTGERDGSAMVVMVKVEKDADINNVAGYIEDALEDIRKRRRGQDVYDFTVMTSEKMSNIAGGIMGAIQTAVFIFAGISILVGGIGITNTMFTAVKERTREIGVLKAIGAKNRDVISIFLIESGIIGLIGGTGGVIFGLIVAKIVESYTKIGAMQIEAYISFSLIFFGLFFSVIVGCMAGFLPARKAARLKPTEALRSYE